MNENEKFMKLALKLAEKGRGNVSPNPMVGCVIVKNRRIVGKGFHEKYGDAHAEINALKDAENKAKNSEMYVTLEPCCHYGKTPPCADAIISAGVKKVFIAMKDPNPKVNGKGIAKLVRKGIAIDIGSLKHDARKLNSAYIKRVGGKHAFVCLKIAMSVNGKISYGNGKGKKITGDESKQRVHELRNEYDAILVGRNTVVKDNPKLTCRIKGCKNPVRIVLDSELKLKGTEHIFREQGEVIIAVTQGASKKKIKKFENKAEIVICKSKNKKVDLKDLMKKLEKYEIGSILVEGGREINESFLKSGVIDKIMLFVSPNVIKGKSLEAFDWKLLDKFQLENAKVEKLGNDILIEGCLK
ncbi:MAG: bifunctional diaminohydroxyphosphoribosylaminopyrimidine deaminase/5-amino-6-(5-phosphoribosylamino)uracil reductase RibD [Candidatus Diapherotrites archaeon]